MSINESLAKDAIEKAAKPFIDLLEWIAENRPEYLNPAHEVQLENWPYTLGIGQIQAVASLAATSQDHTFRGLTAAQLKEGQLRSALNELAGQAALQRDDSTTGEA